MEDEEWIEGYTPRGYHPVHLGEIYNERYEIVYKLGAGCSATIWLAKDRELSRYVALKFMVAKPYNYDNEETILRVLEDKKRDPTVQHEGKHYLIDFYDAFTSISTNGTHRVYVTNVVRPLETYHPQSESGWGVAARQLTLALDFLHSNNITHHDVHIQNVGYMVTLNDADVARLPNPNPNELVDRDDWEWNEHQPRAVYNTSDWFKDSNFPPPEPSALRVQLLDFGNAHAPFCPDPRDSANGVYPAPEIRLGGEKTFASSLDIWCLACALYEWEFYFSFFEAMITRRDGDYVRHLLCIEDTIPERWRPYAEEVMRLHVRNKYDESEPRAWRVRCRCRARELEEKEEKEAMKTHTQVEFQDFFKRAAALEPERRPSARELLAHPYLNHEILGMEGE